MTTYVMTHCVTENLMFDKLNLSLAEKGGQVFVLKSMYVQFYMHENFFRS